MRWMRRENEASAASCDYSTAPYLEGSGGESGRPSTKIVESSVRNQGGNNFYITMNRGHRVYKNTLN